MTQVTCRMDPAFSLAKLWDAGPLTLLIVYAAVVGFSVHNMLQLSHEQSLSFEPACFSSDMTFSQFHPPVNIVGLFPQPACLPLSKPENGGYTCHPTPCRMFAHGTVIEFFCDEGFILTGDYYYLTCQDGQWDGPMQISCVSQGWSDLKIP